MLTVSSGTGKANRKSGFYTESLDFSVKNGRPVTASIRRLPEEDGLYTIR